MRSKIVALAFLLILIIPAYWSLLRPGFFPSHDGEWMVIRLSDFHRSVASGQIPVRWADRLNHGYGYPVFNFLYPLSLYWGEFFHLLGLNFVDAIKMVFALSFILSGIFIYFWLREKWGTAGALTAAILYVYTPYRFLDVYVRGSLGEALAFVFPPLIFWSAEKLAVKWQRGYFILGSLAFAGLIASHNTAAMLVALVFLSYLSWSYCHQRSNLALLRQIGIFFLGLMLSCFFWLPALYDKQYVLFDKVMVADFLAHFPTLRQLLLPSWGYGPSLPFSNQDTLSFQLGVINLLVFGAALWAVLRKPRRSLALFFVLVFASSFFLMLEASSWFWQIIPIQNLIQFPWRLLMLTTFSSAVLAGWLVQSIKPVGKFALAVGLILGAIFLNYSYTRPEYFVNRGEAFYATNEGTTNVANEYLPIWVQSPPLERPASLAEVISGSAVINEVIANSKKINLTVSSNNESLVQINKIYFPGWQARLGGKALSIFYDNPSGVMRFTVPAGKQAIVAEFGETRVRQLADIISLLGLGIIFILILKRR